MCLFKYKEKRYGKLTFILIALVLIALAAASVFGGVYAVINMTHWAKYIIVVVTSLVGLAVGGFGIIMIALSFSLIGTKQSVRDGNSAIGVANTRLCDMCGKVISKKAEFCEHCGGKQQSGLGMKECPECKTKNSALAQFCEKCGKEFDK